MIAKQRTKEELEKTGGSPPDEGNLTPATPPVTLGETARAEKLVALGQLVAVVAHELGNPLSIISSSLQYLHERFIETGDPSADFTRTAIQNVDRMHTMLRGMLDFAAVRKPERHPINLNEVIREVARFTAPEMEKRAVRLEMDLDPNLPLVSADPAGVTQIFLNVFKNALEAISAPSARVIVRSRAHQDHGITSVEIENEGPGIPEDAMSHLFRPFNTTKPSGTGLGLYISRQIAREHGGELRARNVPGGVLLTLTLPSYRSE